MYAEGPYINYVISLGEEVYPKYNLLHTKFGFSEKATKFEKIVVVLLTRASCSVCGQQCTCQKVDKDFLKQMWTRRMIQTLPYLGVGSKLPILRRYSLWTAP